MSAIGCIADTVRHWRLMNRSRMTHKRHWPCTAARVLMPISAPIKVLARADKMPPLKLGGGHATSPVHHAHRRRGYMAARGTGAAARADAAHRRADGVR